MLDTRMWFAIWTAVEAIANNLARTGYTQAAAAIVGHLNTQETTWDGQMFGSRQHTLDLVGLDDRADEWIADGAAMTRDEIAAYTLDHLPELLCVAHHGDVLRTVMGERRTAPVPPRSSDGRPGPNTSGGALCKSNDPNSAW
jgi:hypothetical protein